MLKESVQRKIENYCLLELIKAPQKNLPAIFLLSFRSWFDNYILLKTFYFKGILLGQTMYESKLDYATYY